MSKNPLTCQNGSGTVSGMATNPYKAQAQTRKATTMALSAVRFGFTAERFATDQSARNIVMADCGIEHYSQETLQMAIGAIEAIERDRQSHPDPFAGFPGV
jgi:hypothetical protein